ncbi:MAG: SurA N-terminal domain-containing protein [Pseudomonadota bacterium]|nr:SurA N-terminal domain-containing protein [Pseudomonadota bacterium]
MLQNIRDNSSGIIAKIIVGLIAVTFVVTGVNFFGGGDGDNVIAEVDGIEITQRRFAEKLEQERRQLLNILSDPSAINEDLLRQSVLSALIEEASATRYSQKLSFGVTDQLVDQVLVEIPQFQTDGRFDARLFDQAVGRMGMSRLGFREELKRNLIEYQVKGAIETSMIVTPSELDRLNRLQNHTRSGSLVVIDIDPFVSQMSVNDDEVITHYETNKNSFVTEDSVALEYVLLSANNFQEQVVITDEDIRAAYDAEVASATSDLERRARHILISSAADALAKVNELKQQLDDGADFADLAKKHSDDIASRETGGDLGFAPKGTFDPAFERVLDELSVNTVSQPIETQYGYHLIELLETRARPIDSFEQRSTRLRVELEEREAERLLATSLEEFSNIAFSGTLEELKSTYDVQLESTEPFSRSTAQGLMAKEAVQRRAFNDTLYNGELNAEVFEVEPGVWMTFRVKSFQPKTVRPIDEVRGEIAAILKQKKASEAAQVVAEKIQSHWQDGLAGLPTEASSFSPQEFINIDRNGDDSIDRESLSVAFAASAPNEGHSSTFIAPTNDAFVVARVDQIDLDAKTENDTDLSSALSQLRTSQEGSEFWSVVTRAAEVEKR